MTNQLEAMKMALEALEESQPEAYRYTIDALREAIEAADGYVLVPVEPTEDQIKVGDKWSWPCPSAQIYRAMLAAAPKVGIQPVGPVVPEGYKLVPESALRWLNGEEGDFKCPPEKFFRGKAPTYWWRSVFREKIAAAKKGGA